MRVAFYGAALAVSVATFSLSLSSLLLPNWIRFQTPAGSPFTLRTTYGLFQRCDQSSWSEDRSWTCRPFPSRESDCGERLGVNEARGRLEGGHWGFCESWITARYASQLSLSFAGAAMLSTVIVMSSRGRREAGWKGVAGLMTLHALFQCVTMALIAHEYNVDDRFFYGSRLDASFILSTVSWSANIVVAFVLVLAGALGIREDNYERIRD